jgi:hypothetical protein
MAGEWVMVICIAGSKKLRWRRRRRRGRRRERMYIRPDIIQLRVYIYVCVCVCVHAYIIYIYTVAAEGKSRILFDGQTSGRRTLRAECIYTRTDNSPPRPAHLCTWYTQRPFLRLCRISAYVCICDRLAAAVAVCRRIYLSNNPPRFCVFCVRLGFHHHRRRRLRSRWVQLQPLGDHTRCAPAALCPRERETRHVYIIYYL